MLFKTLNWVFQKCVLKYTFDSFEEHIVQVDLIKSKFTLNRLRAAAISAFFYAKFANETIWLFPGHRWNDGVNVYYNTRVIIFKQFLLNQLGLCLDFRLTIDTKLIQKQILFHVKLMTIHFIEESVFVRISLQITVLVVIMMKFS